MTRGGLKVLVLLWISAPPLQAQIELKLSRMEGLVEGFDATALRVSVGPVVASCRPTSATRVRYGGADLGAWGAVQLKIGERVAVVVEPRDGAAGASGGCAAIEIFRSLDGFSFEAGLAAAERGDFSGAMTEFKGLASAGNAWAQYELGLLYEEGKGAQASWAEAFALYQKAAARGSPLALLRLAQVYEKGRGGVAIDTAMARRHYEGAAGATCDAGSPGRACRVAVGIARRELGQAYYHGRGVPQDRRSAVDWWTRAAQVCDVLAQNNLATAYLNGDGVAKDVQIAAHWYRQAAERGIASSQYTLGAMHAAAMGVDLDFVQAAMWLTLADLGGDARAANAIRAIAPRLTEQQRQEAAALAKRFQPGPRPERCPMP